MVTLGSTLSSQEIQDSVFSTSGTSVTVTQTYAISEKEHASMASADLTAFVGGVTAFEDAAERDNILTQFNLLRADVLDLKQFVNYVVDVIKQGKRLG